VPSSHQPRSGRAFCQVCVPVLLVGLLLYNPFLALISHSDGLTYQALARHRATVGASEMQHYAAPAPGENAQLEANVESVFTGIVVENKESTSHRYEDEALPQRPELLVSLWFRPPPAA
jgi:hypothetical protein